MIKSWQSNNKEKRSNVNLFLRYKHLVSYSLYVIGIAVSMKKIGNETSKIKANDHSKIKKQEYYIMAKAQIATWHESVAERETKKEISEQFVSTMRNLANEIDNESTSEQDTIITQIIYIAEELLSGDNGDYRFMSATVVDEFVTVFAGTARANEIIAQSLNIISSWNASNNHSRQVAIKAAGQIAVTISDLDQMTPQYAGQILALFNSAAADTNSEVKNGASNTLGEIVKVFVTAFSGQPGMEIYIEQLYGAINSLITDSSNGVRISAATAMLTVINTLANAKTLSTYTAQTLAILTNLIADADSSVRATSIEILQPLLISISGIPAYNTQSQWLLNQFNLLMSDNDSGVRDSASETLQIAIAQIGDDHVAYLATIANFETIINLDLLNYSDTIQDAIISSIPEKLTEYEARLDESNDSSITIISNNFNAITGLLSMIGNTDTEVLQAASDRAQTTLNKIVTKLINDDISIANFDAVIEWINGNFDTLAQHAAAEIFFQNMFNKIITHQNMTAMDAAFIAKCASADYVFVTTQYINNVAAWLNNKFELYEQLGSDDPEGTFQVESYEAILRKELASGNTTEVDVTLAGKCLDAGYDFVTSVDEVAGTYTMSEIS